MELIDVDELEKVQKIYFWNKLHYNWSYDFVTRFGLEELCAREAGESRTLRLFVAEKVGERERVEVRMKVFCEL